MIDKPRRKQGGRRGGGTATPAASSQAVELFTLGRLALRLQGEDVTGKFGAKHLAFLIYLFHERRPMNPSEIIELLGRGRDEETELQGLKRTVSFLSEKLPGLRIMMTSETIEAVRGVLLDTVIVEDALDRDDPAPIAKLYRGDFLEGFESDSTDFDAWAAKERARINRAWSRAILRAARDAHRNENWKAALGWWRVRVARVPLHDEAVAGLLRALANAEGKNAATEAYAVHLSQLKEKGQPQPADVVKKVVTALRLPKKPPPLKPKPLHEVTQPPGTRADETQTPDASTRSDAATLVAEPPAQVERVELEEPVKAAPEEPAAVGAKTASASGQPPAPTRLAPPPPLESDNGQPAEAAAELEEIVELASAEEAEFLLAAMAESAGEAGGTVTAAAAEAEESEVGTELPVEGEEAEPQPGADEVALMAVDELPGEAEDGTGAV
ncbi:MAG: bacterial transcriptional activator domain-containing protein, partial [Gemmatimonadota bacterium]